MRLHCLRHGMTEGNLAGRFNGASEQGITGSEKQSLSRVAFDHGRYDAVYCSPLTRCVETAQSLRIPRWTPDPRIAERRFGIFEGFTARECEQMFPAEFARFLRFDAHFVIPNGESRAQNLRRVLLWLEEAGAYENVLAVTHGGTIDFLYRLGTNIAVHGGERIFSGDNASISIFDVEWPRVTLVDYSVALDAIA